MRRLDGKFLRRLDNRRALSVIVFCLAIILATVLAGCGGDDTKNDYGLPSFEDPSGETMKTVVKTTVPMAYAASVAMSAVTGSVPPNAFATGTCFSYPCAAMVTITDDDSAMPLQLGDFETMTVYGYWQTQDRAILTVVFSRDAGSALFPVHDIAVFPVSRMKNKLLVTYAGMDINATVTDPGSLGQTEIDLAFLKLTLTPSTEAEQNLGMDAWIIETDEKNTPDFSDDTYTISGAGVYSAISLQADSVQELAMAQVMMSPDCTLNPASGFAVLQDVALSSTETVFGQAVIAFYPDCNGKALVLVGNGSYLLATGSSIPINLDTPQQLEGNRVIDSAN